MGIFKPNWPRVQRGHPLARGLVGAWKFTEGSGLTAYDSSGFGNHGTLTNGPTWIGGPRGSLGNFARTSSQYVDCGSPAMPTIVTVLATVLVLDTTATQKTIVSKGYDAANTQWELIITTAGNKFRFQAYIPPSGRGATAGSTVATNTFYRLAGLYTGATYQIYVNGVLDGSSTDTGPIATAKKLEIGAVDNNGAAANFWNGYIDDVLIYNRALSAAEIEFDHILHGP